MLKTIKYIPIRQIFIKPPNTIAILHIHMKKNLLLADLLNIYIYIF